MIFIPMKYHSIYFDECDKNSTVVVCGHCKRSFYVPDDLVDDLVRTKLSKSSDSDYICEACANELENDGKIKVKKSSSTDNKEAVIDILDSGLSFLSDSFEEISNVLEDMRQVIDSSLGC